MASGILYWLILSIFSLYVVAVLLEAFDRSLVGILVSVPFLIGVVFFSYYGFYLTLTGARAPVNEDLNLYLLPVIGSLAGGDETAEANDIDSIECGPSEGGDCTSDPGDSEGKHMAPIECISCGATVQSGTMKCPNCSYYPMKALAASGTIYAVVGLALVFIGGGISAMGIAVLGRIGLVFVLLPLIGFAVWFYGTFMAFGWRDATVRDDYVEYALPILQ